MPKASDYTTPFGDALGMVEFVRGLFDDLDALRAGRITVEEARARAQLADVALKGVRVMLQGSKYLSDRAKELPPAKDAGGTGK